MRSAKQEFVPSNKKQVEAIEGVVYHRNKKVRVQQEACVCPSGKHVNKQQKKLKLKESTGNATNKVLGSLNQKRRKHSEYSECSFGRNAPKNN